MERDLVALVSGIARRCVVIFLERLGQVAIRLAHQEPPVHVEAAIGFGLTDAIELGIHFAHFIIPGLADLLCFPSLVADLFHPSDCLFAVLGGAGDPVSPLAPGDLPPTIGVGGLLCFLFLLVLCGCDNSRLLDRGDCRGCTLDGRGWGIFCGLGNRRGFVLPQVGNEPRAECHACHNDEPNCGSNLLHVEPSSFALFPQDICHPRPGSDGRTSG